MKNIFKYLIPMVLLTLIQSTGQALVRAGGIGDGGGQGIVCRNDDGTVRAAELLDLVESKDYFLRTLQPQPGSRPYLEIAQDYAAILDGAMPNTDPTDRSSRQTENQPPTISYEVGANTVFNHTRHSGYIGSLVHAIDQGKMLIPGNDLRIPPVGDSHPRILPSAKGCGLEQIAVYTDGVDEVHFVGGVWEKLDNVNKAALLVHEALYHELRAMGDSTSDRTRKTVGYLFSGMKFEWVLNGLPQKYLFCWTDDEAASFRFAVYPESEHSVTALFLVYNGETMLTKTMSSLDSDPFSKAFGLPASLLKPNESVITLQVLNNPLIEMPKYEFTVQADSMGNISGLIEAVSLTAGFHAQRISCNSQLSSVHRGEDGSVTVEPAGLR